MNKQEINEQIELLNSEIDKTNRLLNESINNIYQSFDSQRVAWLNKCLNHYESEKANLQKQLKKVINNEMWFIA